jgi:hypothetical protein
MSCTPGVKHLPQALPSAGTSLTVAAASVAGLSGAAASGLATVDDTGPTTGSVAGTNPFEILDSMFTTMSDLDTAVDIETGSWPPRSTG